MRPPIEWTEQDLEELVQLGVKEGLELEFKRCDALRLDDKSKTEVSKDVSAFANSAGGTIVYGIVERDHFPVAVDTGFDPAGKISKEWLEQVINSNIHRRIDGIRINVVDLKRGNDKRFAYVVVIPQSPRAAHQAADKRFYKRFNFESVPMEEYEIRDVSTRLQSPDIRLSFEAVEDPAANPQSLGKAVKFSAVATNESSTPAEYVLFRIFIDARLKTSKPPLANNATGTLSRGDKVFPAVIFTMSHCIPVSIPIFRGLPYSVVSPQKLIIPEEGEYLIFWEVHCPRTEKRIGSVIVRWDGNLVTVSPQSRCADVSSNAEMTQTSIHPH